MSNKISNITNKIKFSDKKETACESMRIACDQVIKLLGDSCKNLVLVSADGSISPSFAKKYTDRFYDVGIAEQNQVCIAAGLALKGKKVIISAIISHLIFNALMQIRNTVCFSKLDVIIIGVGAGLGYGNLGFTHHAPEDIAIMNTLPHMKLYLPSDANEARLALIDSFNKEGPAYIRLGASLDPLIYSKNKLKKISFNKPMKIKEGNNLLIIATGYGVSYALQVSDLLLKQNIDAEILNINSLNIYKLDKILPFLNKHKLIIVLEEHFKETGLGSLIVNQFYGKINIPIIKFGIEKDYCDFAGSRDELLQHYNMNPKVIYKTIINKLKGK